MSNNFFFNHALCEIMLKKYPDRKPNRWQYCPCAWHAG